MKFIGWTTMFVFVLALCGSLLIFVKDGESGNHLLAAEKRIYNVVLADGTVCSSGTAITSLGYWLPSSHDDTYHGDDPADGHPDGHWQWPVVVSEPPPTNSEVDECPCDDEDDEDDDASGNCDDS